MYEKVVLEITYRSVKYFLFFFSECSITVEENNRSPLCLWLLETFPGELKISDDENVFF